MISTSSTAGMFRRLNSRERLRSVDGKHEKGKEKQTSYVDIGENDDSSEDEAVPKKDLIVARRMIVLDKTDSERK